MFEVSTVGSDFCFGSSVIKRITTSNLKVKKSRDGNGTTDRSLESTGVRALEAEGAEFTGGNQYTCLAITINS